MPIELRPARAIEAPSIRLLHRAAIWGFGTFDYTLWQLDSFLRQVDTLDMSLIASGRYFVAESDGELVGCGGWSGDGHIHPLMRTANINESPAGSAPSAKMRAIFVHPKWARQGVGFAIMDHVEARARAAGFARAELLSTLTAFKLYDRCGYQTVERREVPLPDGTWMAMIHMAKALSQVTASGFRAPTVPASADPRGSSPRPSRRSSALASWCCRR